MMLDHFHEYYAFSQELKTSSANPVVLAGGEEERASVAEWLVLKLFLKFEESQVVVAKMALCHLREQRCSAPRQNYSTEHFWPTICPDIP